MAISKHLSVNEKIMAQFRPSRKAFVGEYLLFIIFASIAIFTLLQGRNTSNPNVILMYYLLFYLSLMLALIVIMKAEYKIWSKSFAITNEKIMTSEGLFSETFKSCVFLKITDIGLKQSFFDKLMDTGSLDFNTSGTNVVELKMYNIARPLHIKKLISDASSLSIMKNQQHSTHHHQQNHHHAHASSKVNHQVYK